MQACQPGNHESTPVGAQPQHSTVPLTSSTRCIWVVGRQVMCSRRTASTCSSRGQRCLLAMEGSKRGTPAKQLVAGWIKLLLAAAFQFCQHPYACLVRPPAVANGTIPLLPRCPHSSPAPAAIGRQAQLVAGAAGAQQMAISRHAGQCDAGPITQHAKERVRLQRLHCIVTRMGVPARCACRRGKCARQLLG